MSTEDKKGSGLDYKILIERYKYLIGLLLILAIIFSSVFLLWKQNYFVPNIEKRIGVVENKVDALANSKTSDTVGVPVEVDKLIAQSQTGAETSGQVAGVTNTDVKPSTPIVKQIIGKININSASEVQLDTLPGIGPAYAKKIIDYRNAKNGFKSIEEIKEIKGIGDVTFNKLKDLISI